MLSPQQILLARSLKGSLGQIAVVFLLARTALDLKQIRTCTGLNQETARDCLTQLNGMGLLAKQIAAHGRVLWVPAGALLPGFMEIGQEASDSQVAEIPRSGNQVAEFPRPGSNVVVVDDLSLNVPTITTTTTTTRDQVAEFPRPGSEAVVQDPNSRSPEEWAALNVVLSEYQIIGKKRRDLIACAWVTAEYVRASVEYAKAENLWDLPVGMAITRMLEQVAMPAMRENEHVENCKCAQCKVDDFMGRGARRAYASGFMCETCSQHPCICDESEDE